MPTRRTKIVATIGPASDPPDVLRGLFEAGVDVARVGLAHGPVETTIDRIARIRTAAKDVGRPVGILADLPGPKVRAASFGEHGTVLRSEEHPSELQSLMRNSYAVFRLKKKNKQ